MPLSYYVATATCILLFFISIQFGKAGQREPYCAVLLTIAIWYLIEPFYTKEDFALFFIEYVSTAYLSVTIFLISFAVLVPLMVRLLTSRQSQNRALKAEIKTDKLIFWVIILWVVLLAFGTLRLNGDLLQALFPIGSRTGGHMWSRAAGAGAGPIGFIVSTAAYLYTLCTAAFGVLFFLVSTPRVRIALLILIVISWPYSLLMGSRSLFLATCLPALIAYALISRQPKWLKAVLLCSAVIAINQILLLIIASRNEGFAVAKLGDLENQTHFGLNMASELIYAISYVDTGILKIDYGLRYLQEGVNIIPRAIWPEKPILGIDYTIARGFGSINAQDIGVTATISTGVIGQGTLAFGPFIGPMFAALLLAGWVAALTRFWRQGTPVRLILFLIGLGLTFNLGRDFTLLVLWPIVFAYLAARVLESIQAKAIRRKNLRAVPHAWFRSGGNRHG